MTTKTNIEAVDSGQTEREAWDVALDALDDYQRNWDTGLPAEYASGERIAMECAVEAVREALNEARAASPQAPAEAFDGEFKNFHRLLCERFGYAHDEKDWKRDQLSLIECIANWRDQFEFLDVQNHVARQAMRKIMARLTELLDEDRFAEIEEIVRNAGVEPPQAAADGEPAAAPQGLTDERILELARKWGMFASGIQQIQGFARDVFAEQSAAPMAASPQAPAVDGAEAVAIYHGTGIIDCGDHGHHNLELLKLIPAGSKLYLRPLTREAATVTEGWKLTMYALSEAISLLYPPKQPTEKFSKMVEQARIAYHDALAAESKTLPRASEQADEAVTELIEKLRDHHKRDIVDFDILLEAATSLEALGADAARYRHLRDCNSGSLVIVEIIGMGEEDQVVLTEDDADKAIDAARAKDSK